MRETLMTRQRGRALAAAQPGAVLVFSTRARLGSDTETARLGEKKYRICRKSCAEDELLTRTSLTLPFAVLCCAE